MWDIYYLSSGENYKLDHLKKNNYSNMKPNVSHKSKRFLRPSDSNLSLILTCKSYTLTYYNEPLPYHYQTPEKA